LIITQAQNDTESEEPDIADLFGGKTAELPPSSPLLANVGGRETQTLNGDWNIVVDEHRAGARGLFGGAYYEPPKPWAGMELVEHSFDPRRSLRVPGDWNTQDETLFLYRGVVWYQREFEIEKAPGQRYFLHFDGVNYTARVYLNGVPVAQHRGGYVAFNVEATEAIQDGDNFLVVEVDAELNDSTIPTVRTSDFFKYGGITRDVTLVTVPEIFVRQYHLYLDELEGRKIKGWVQLDGEELSGREVQLAIPGAGVELTAQTDADGRAEFRFTADVELWSPESPRLYEVAIGNGSETVEDHIGFRSIETRGEQILLNGEPVYLRGISLHDESVLKPGVANDSDAAAAQLGLAKELNCNFVRLSHYPHNEHTLREADELGLMVWSEIPIVSLIDWDNPATLAVARQQISDNLHRDLNRAAVVMWSIANESMPRSPERLEFLRVLAQDARAIDESSRPLAAALIGDPTREFTRVIQRLVAEMLVDPEIDESARAHLHQMAAHLIDRDPQAVRDSEIEIMLEDELGEFIDIIGYNEYFGWYYSAGLAPRLPVDEGTVRRHMLGIMPDIRFRNAFGKPIVISEFGAGARQGFASELGPGMLWSEEYQARVYEAQIDMLGRSPSIQGMSPWILKDFRSMLRQLNGIQEGYNRKGLVSEKGEKKKAFFVLQDHYRRTEQKH
jgi:beta-glucuronidase